eukprot:RCo011428
MTSFPASQLFSDSAALGDNDSPVAMFRGKRPLPALTWPVRAQARVLHHLHRIVVQPTLGIRDSSAERLHKATLATVLWVGLAVAIIALAGASATLARSFSSGAFLGNYWAAVVGSLGCVLGLAVP